MDSKASADFAEPFVFQFKAYMYCFMEHNGVFKPNSTRLNVANLMEQINELPKADQDIMFRMGAGCIRRTMNVRDAHEVAYLLNVCLKENDNVVRSRDSHCIPSMICPLSFRFSIITFIIRRVKQLTKAKSTRLIWSVTPIATLCEIENASVLNEKEDEYKWIPEATGKSRDFKHNYALNVRQNHCILLHSWIEMKNTWYLYFIQFSNCLKWT